MSEAQKAKHTVEEEQRARRKNKTDFVPRFFVPDEKEEWKFVGKFPTWDDQEMDA